ncbi:MAG TPA: CHAD domain-containing protein [Streptosporangiaceae bacterium]|nr:CHAD domain-containing protein [Streptosporangiaceae bacterium]
MADTSLDDVTELPGSGFSLVAGVRLPALRRTWLDTFDWRLYRAGLTLEQVTGRGIAELRLTGRDGALTAIEQLGGPAPRWPGQLDALPAGPLAEHLAPVIGVRALLPVARATSARRQQRALNTDAKTIARITADQMSVTYPARVQLPARLTVTAVRGYQAPAARLAGLLSAPADGAVSGLPALEAALGAAGRRPGDYSGRIDLALDPKMPAAPAMASVFAALLGTLEANLAGTIADTDTEFLHDLRVAVRRTRTALKLAGHVLPRGARTRFQGEFRWLGDLTTPTRDLDVYLLSLPAMTASLIGADPADLGPFADHLRRRRAGARRELVRGLRSARFAGLRQDWRAVLEQAAVPARRKPAAAALAAASIAAVHEKVLASGAAITPASPALSLHDLRKRCKELRYLLEIFASLHPPGAHWRAVKELKRLQDCLGEFQDTDVQRAELRAFAAQMMDERLAPAQTLLAMGEIAAGLARRQHRARAEFGGLFAEFASPAGQARITALTRVAGG